MHGRSDKNSFDCSKTQHYQTPRGQLSRQRIKFEILVNSSDANIPEGGRNYSGSQQTRSQANGGSSYKKKEKGYHAKRSSARSELAGKVKVFQFGGGHHGQRSANYFELSDDQQSSPNLQEQDVETEFSRLREKNSLYGDAERFPDYKSTAHRDRFNAL